MSTETNLICTKADEAIAAATAAKGDADAAIAAANAAKSQAQAIATWVPPGGGGGGGGAPAAWPATINCVGGTVPAVITIPNGDGAPTGQMGEPGYSRRISTMPEGAIGIFGDSIIQMMHQSRMHAACENYALGGQSLRRLINLLRGLPFMQTAGAGVILSGVNDLGNTTYYGPRTNGSAVNNLLSMYSTKLKPWLTGKWVIGHLLPCDETAYAGAAAGYNAQIAAVNAGLASAMSGCAAQIAFIPVDPSWVDGAGDLKDEYHIDNQHPSKAFCRIYEDAVKAALATLGL